MTDAQIFQIFGIGLFAMGLAWIMQPTGFRKTLRDVYNSKGILLTLGIFTLVVGYMIIALHRTDFVLITILGWTSLAKGIGIILLSATDMEISSLYVKLKTYYSILPWCIFFIGIFLLGLGFLG